MYNFCTKKLVIKCWWNWHLVPETNPVNNFSILIELNYIEVFSRQKEEMHSKLYSYLTPTLYWSHFYVNNNFFVSKKVALLEIFFITTAFRQGCRTRHLRGQCGTLDVFVWSALISKKFSSNIYFDIEHLETLFTLQKLIVDKKSFFRS